MLNVSLFRALQSPPPPAKSNKNSPLYQNLSTMTSRQKKPSPLGTSIFVGLRAADTVLQYSILQRGWGSQLIQSLGGSVVPFATPRDPALAYFGLGPYPAILSALALGASAKHVAYMLGIAEQEMTPPAAVMIAALNTIFNTLNTMFSLWTITSAAPQMATQSASITDVIASSPTLMLGLGLYIVGIVTELASEVDRQRFKAKPENKGKPYGGGLWSWATHINYGGFTLWRTGYAVSAAGLPWGALVGVFFFYDFTSRAIPSLDKYCTEKVGCRRPGSDGGNTMGLLPFIVVVRSQNRQRSGLMARK
ncbi:MAG: hypothetical protein Q9175_005116 [Cornicularia normoerica]